MRCTVPFSAKAGQQWWSRVGDTEGDKVLARDRDVVWHYFLLVVSLSFRDLQSIKLHEMLTETLLRIKRKVWDT